jgi:hypothetical protein
MPDYNVTSRDPYLRAKARADAQHRCWTARLLTGSVCLLTPLIALAFAGTLATDANARAMGSVACLLVGLVALVVLVMERNHQRKRSRLVDELWATYAAEEAQTRTGPIRTPRSTLRGGRSRSAPFGVA